MTKVKFEKFVEIFNRLPVHSECEISFLDCDETYVLIKYENCISFQRCGYSAEMIADYGLENSYIDSGEEYYENIEMLCLQESVDGICLAQMWDSIDSICVNGTYDIDEVVSVCRK